MRAFSGASLATAMLALSMSVGCQYLGQIQAKRSFKQANAAYQSQDYKKASLLYAEVVQEDPNFDPAYFYLGNCYDNLYKPSKKGDPANDDLLNKAVENYTIAADRLSASQFPNLKEIGLRSLQYLVGMYSADKLDQPAKQEEVLIKMINQDPTDPINYRNLSKLYEDAALYDDSERVLLLGKAAKPTDAGIYLELASFYNKQGEFPKTMDALYERAKVEPTNPEAFQTISAYYWDEVRADGSLTEATKREYLGKGLEAVETALKLKSDYVEAIAYKGLLLRLQANLEKDGGKQQAMLKEAQALEDQANALKKTKGSAD